MKKNFKCLLLAALCCASILSASAQRLTFEQYISAVAQKNAAYLAEKYNVSIAMANMRAARVFNDPELSVTYGNNEDWSLMMGQSVEVELSYNINLGGVRRARIHSANSEMEVSQASVDAYLCNLRSEACQAWAEAWRLRQKCNILRENIQDMDRIAQSDSIRLSVGDIGRTDAMQSSLEARTLRSELLTAEAEYRNALLGLSYLAGEEAIEDIDAEALPQADSYKQWLSCEPDKLDKLDELDKLNQIAEENRADLRAAELSQQLSANNLKLLKASRAMELGVSVGYSWNKEVRNEIAPAPAFNGFTVGVSVPLKFSNSNKGEMLAAGHAIEQSKATYEAARQQVRTEVAQAYNTYTSARSVMEQYQGNILSDARTVLENRRAGYQLGETTLLEFLAAQQSYREVMEAYIDACANSYASEVLLRQAIGL